MTLLALEEVQQDEAISTIQSQFCGTILKYIRTSTSFDSSPGGTTTENFELGFENLKRAVPFLWLRIRGCSNSRGELIDLDRHGQEIHPINISSKKQFYSETYLFKVKKELDNLILEFSYSAGITSKMIFTHPEEIDIEC